MPIRFDIRGGINIERPVSWVNAYNQVSGSSSGGGKEEEPEAGRCSGRHRRDLLLHFVPLPKTLQAFLCHLQNNVLTLQPSVLVCCTMKPPSTSGSRIKGRRAYFYSVVSGAPAGKP